MIVLELDGDSNNLSPNKRLHWRSEHRLKKQWRDRARFAALLVNGDALPLQGRVRVSFVIRRGRKLDADNAASSKALKAILDGIVEAGALKDDSLIYCERGTVEQEVGKQYRLQPSVIVRLEEITET